MDGQRKALIVANDEYEHEGLRHLLAPAADAEALAGVLGDSQIGDFDVRVVHNEPAHDIEAQIEDLFADSRPDDVLLLHFSCHGLKSESGDLFFAARNTRPNRLGSTAVSADFVQRCMRASRSRSIVLLLDCCYGGAFGQGVAVRAAGDVNVLDSFPGGKLGGGRGRAVITASSAMEYAFEGDRLADDQSPQPSVFTSALVEGLASGEADRDEDGWVSLNELYDYVFDRVREQNPHQTPSRDVEMQGDLYLARSRRQRIRALPIPPDLQAAMTDPNMFTRLGAVAELRARLTSDNLPAAAGAGDALAEMARTDIRYVAEAAATALAESAPRVVEPELHFGQVHQGSNPPQHTLHLLGPPLARAGTVHTSHSWIQVDQTGEGIDVSVDTSRTGNLRGDITITGPTGEATVTVDVVITTGQGEPDDDPDYAAARAAFFTERWDTAVDLLDRVLTRHPDHPQITQWLAHARHQHQKAEWDADAQAAVEETRWSDAVAALEHLVAARPDDPALARRLESARAAQKRADLQADLRRLYVAGQWAAVITAGEQLAELDPHSADLDGLVTAAKAELAEAGLADRYATGLLQLDRGDWVSAEKTFTAIQAERPDYRDIAALLARAREQGLTAQPPAVAEMVQRFLARFIDWMIFLIPLLILTPTSGGAGTTTGTETDPLTLGDTLRLLGMLLTIAVYEVVLTAHWGNTLGKRLLRLKVVRRRDGGPVGWGTALLRWVVQFIAWVPGLILGAVILYLSPFWDSTGRRQGWHDKLAGTVVVKLPPR